MMKRRVIEVFYFDAGGGHGSAMRALRDVIAEQYPGWQVNPVNLQDLLEPLDPVRKTTQIVSSSLNKFMPGTPFKVTQAQDFYNNLLKKGSTRGMTMGLRMTQLFIKSAAPQMEDLLRQHWLDEGREKPDLVVSVIPNFNRPMFNALKGVYPAVPYVTILTDMVDYPPHFWMEDQNQIIVCGTDKAFKQAHSTGFYRPENILKVSGMILRKSFYDKPDATPLMHEDLGLSPDRPTALVMFGGNGASVSGEIVSQLNAEKVGVQTIVMCGKNKELLASLQGQENCHPVGFVSNVADYMRLSDIFIGKPGPGSISEAVHIGCPVIVERNSATMPQERPNVDWVLDNAIGVAVKNFRIDSVEAVRFVIGNLAQYKENIKRNIPQNRAVYEIADLFDRVMSADLTPHATTSMPTDEKRVLTYPATRRTVRALKRRFKQSILG